VVTLLASVTLSLIPFSAPALADPPRPPAARDDSSRQREVERLRAVAEEQQRQAELRRNVQAMQAHELQRDLERQTEHARVASLAAEARMRADARRAEKSSSPLTATSGEAVSLQACNDSASQQVIAPAASVVLIGKSWITKSRGLGEAYIKGTRVELSIGGVPIANAERFFVAPMTFDHPVLGRVWITRWEYPLTINTQTPIAVHVRWTLDHQLVDLVVFNEDGTPMRYPAGFSMALSCTLVPAVSVSGQITGGGVGLPDARVTVYDAPSGVFRASAGTNANGEFTILLPPGEYRFFFSASAPWLPEWWDDRASFNEATIVTLTLGVIPPRLNADLARGVIVTGRVTDAGTHLPVAGVGVNAQRADAPCCESFFTSTDADGRYRLAVRENVTLTVGFFPPPSATPYLGQWWNGRRSFSEADVLSVGTVEVAGIDAALERGVFVRGRVTDAANDQPLANVNVSAHVVSGLCCETFFASTNAQGEYTMMVRTNVTIIVGFFPQPSDIPYIPSYWNGRRSFAEADPIAVGTFDVSAINAALERGVFMRGRVTDALTGSGIPQATVIASVGTCCGESFFASTSSDGTYVTAVRRNVTLQVRFDGPFGSSYLTQWFDGRATIGDADPVLVTTVDVLGVDAALERGVFVRGRVTEADTGAPIALANVTVSLAGMPCCDNTYASTDTSGDYAVVVRRNMSVQVFFSPPFGSSQPFLSQWYQGKPSFETADVVPVGSSDVLGIDAALERGVFVRGHVRDAVTLAPIAGAGVLAFDLVPCCVATFAETDAGGEYRVVARKNAAVKVNFRPPFGGAIAYIGQWYNAKASFSEADVVPVGSADVLGIDGALERGLFVRGRVTDAVSGEGIAGVGVNAQRVDVPCCETFFAATEADGRYALILPPSITVKVLFVPSFSDPLPHLSEWWNDHRSFEQADPLTIGTADISGIDAALEIGVFVRGHVIETETGHDLAQVSVNAFVVDAPCCENFFSVTDASGNYAMAVRTNTGLKVSFFPPLGSDLLQEYYDNKPDFGSADVIAVGVVDVSGINAALERGVRLSGRVSDTLGGAIRDVGVNVETEACCAFVAGTATAIDGTYSLAVRPGRYKVAFYPPPASDYLPEYYDDKPHSGVADVVVIGTAPVTGIDATLEQGVPISGRVTDAAGNVGLQGIFVSVQTAVCCAGVTGTQTGADGTYSVAVRPGSYKVGFFPPQTSDLLYEFYDDVRDVFAATVLVVESAPVSGIDAALDRGVRVGGRVLDPEGLGAPNVSVNLESPTDCAWIAGAGTNFDGTYFLVVRPGSYKVSFAPQPSSDLLSEHYNNKTTCADADVLTAVIGTPLVNIDAVLERGTSMSGRVTDAITGNGVQGVYVGFQTVVCCQATGTTTQADGTYAIAVRQGSYKIGFTPPDGSGLRFEWYDNKTNFLLADVVTVGATPVTGIDALLEHLASAPTIVDARVAQNVGTSDFAEVGDAFVLTFSVAMDPNFTADTLRIEDQDGTVATVACGVVPNRASCPWSNARTVMTVTLDLSTLEVPPIGQPGAGTTPGMQIPFNIAALVGFSDVAGTAPDVLGSPDRLVDYE